MNRKRSKRPEGLGFGGPALRLCTFGLPRKQLCREGLGFVALELSHRRCNRCGLQPKQYHDSKWKASIR